MLHLGITLMLLAALAALALYWREHTAHLATHARASELAAAGAQALEAANKWREAYWALRRRVQPVQRTVCAPVFHSPRGLDDE